MEKEINLKLIEKFEKKYAKVLQCIIYFVTLQPETLEVLPL